MTIKSNDLDIEQKIKVSKRENHLHEALKETLSKSEQQYRLLADNISDIIACHSLDGTVRYVSPSVYFVLGYEPSELIGTDGFNHLIPSDELHKIQSKIVGLLEEENKVDQMEHRILKKDGNYIWVETKSRLHQSANNDQPFEIISVSREISKRKLADLALQKKEKELRGQTRRLKETNIALKVLLKQRQREKKDFEELILGNVKRFVLPYIEKMENNNLNEKNATYLGIIKSNLMNLISPFSDSLSSRYLNLTPSELQIADLIKHGKTSKEIASILNVSPKAVSFHRGNLRKKLGINNKKINLRVHLQSIPQQAEIEDI